MEEYVRRIANALDWYVEESESDRRARFALAIFSSVISVRISDPKVAAKFSVEAADALLDELNLEISETKEPK